MHFSREEIESVTADVQIQLELHQQNDSTLAEAQKRRLVVLDRKKQRLLDAYLDGVIEEADLKTRQAGILHEREDAKRLIRQSEFSIGVARDRADLLLRLMSRAVKLYDAVTDEERGWLNRAVFSSIRVDMIDDEPENHERGEIAADGHFTEPMAAMALVVEDALAGLNGAHAGTQGRTAGEGAALATPEKQQKTPGGLSPTGGSNVHHLAVTVGFEPDEVRSFSVRSSRLHRIPADSVVSQAASDHSRSCSIRGGCGHELGKA